MLAEDLGPIVEGLERIFTDAALSPSEVDLWRGEQANALWSTLEENGYPLLCVAEQHGGIGVPLAHICDVALLAGQLALPLPIADTLLANALLSLSGLEPPAGKTGVLDPLDQYGMLAYGGQLSGAVRLHDGLLSYHLIESSQVSPFDKYEDGAGILAPPLGEAQFSQSAPNWLTPGSMRALAALVRAAQMAGAMQAILDLTLSYTKEREQFGRPLAKFQAVQHHLSDIACETAASIAAVENASDALHIDPQLSQSTQQDLVIAKIRCGEAAARVAAASHQAHGAMGFTFEYSLGQFTRRLWQWQDDFGSSDEWAIHIGHAVLAKEKPALWSHVSREF